MSYPEDKNTEEGDEQMLYTKSSLKPKEVVVFRSFIIEIIRIV